MFPNHPLCIRYESSILTSHASLASYASSFGGSSLGGHGGGSTHGHHLKREGGVDSVMIDELVVGFVRGRTNPEVRRLMGLVTSQVKSSHSFYAYF